MAGRKAKCGLAAFALITLLATLINPANAASVGGKCSKVGSTELTKKSLVYMCQVRQETNLAKSNDDSGYDGYDDYHVNDDNDRRRKIFRTNNSKRQHRRLQTDRKQRRTQQIQRDIFRLPANRRQLRTDRHIQSCSRANRLGRPARRAKPTRTSNRPNENLQRMARHSF